ncbi:hypothetical protein [Polaribacter sp.]|uniref:hypothetical protein n=1 Tax=Polaribacter sp. TaxID=1920175 RepID=UPI003F6CC495
MAGEGFIAHMIASLKANKRNRVSTFDKLKDFKYRKPSELHFPNKASAKELKNIRKKIKKENNLLFFKKVLTILFLLALCIYTIVFVES